LEAEGFILRGKFHPGVQELEWCERRLAGADSPADLEPAAGGNPARGRSKIFNDSCSRGSAWTPNTAPKGRKASKPWLDLLDGYELAAAAWGAGGAGLARQGIHAAMA